MVEELIKKKIEYLESLNTKDVRVLAKLEELRWVLQMIRLEENKTVKIKNRWKNERQ